MIVAAADLTAECDSQRLSAAGIITRAGVEPRDFHAAFSSVEDCLLASFDEGLSRLTLAITKAVPAWARLLPKIEAGLDALLTFLEEEPGWGQVLLIQLPEGARARRQRALARLSHELSQITTRSLLDPDPPPSEADAARVTSQALRIITANVRRGEPVAALAPWLMSTVIEPELTWQPDGRAEAGGHRNPGAHATAMLADACANTGRAARVLRAVSRTPRGSNRQIAQATGVPNDSNVSAHLRRLERDGLIRNLTLERGRGHPNAWVLTHSGEAAVGWRNAQSRARLRAA